MYFAAQFRCISCLLTIACFFLELQQRCLEELDVLDQMSRLSIDPFQHNRRLSETNLLDLKCQAHNDTCPTRSESHSVAQSPPPHLEKISLLSKDYKEPDNPFQNDALPLWENKKRSPKPAEKKTGTPFNSHSNISSPDNNNYGGQQQAYRYRSLNETPTSPELANHRMYQGASSSPPPSPEIIQVKALFILILSAATINLGKA